MPEVLIVDDDSEVLKTLYRYTESLGLHTTAVGTLREALMHLGKVDILIVDENVNGGRVSTDMLMEEWVKGGHGPVCVLTEDISLERRQGLLQNGAYNVLTKPLSMETYSTILQRYRNMVFYRQRCAELEQEMSDQLEKFKETSKQELKQELSKIRLKFWLVVAVSIFSIITGQVNITELLNSF